MFFMADDGDDQDKEVSDDALMEGLGDEDEDEEDEDAEEASSDDFSY